MPEIKTWKEMAVWVTEKIGEHDRKIDCAKRDLGTLKTEQAVIRVKVALISALIGGVVGSIATGIGGGIIKLVWKKLIGG